MKHIAPKLAVLLGLASIPVLAAGSPTLVNGLIIPGETTDRYVGAAGANYDRLGGPFSDLYYDRQNQELYGLVDRGPGGGLISYETRLEKMKVNVDDKTGAISNFRIQSTILFRTADGSEPFNGLNPQLLNGDKSVLGNCFDPEGITFGPKGELYISDEYGPSVYEFEIVNMHEARFVRAFVTPDNLIPREGTAPNYVDGRPVINSGRQDNRGFEGLTITPDGTTLVACMQDPLVAEGANNDGRRSTNVRLVTWNVATGLPTAQYIYQLESIASINTRVPTAPFSATNQGRSIGLSGIFAVNNTDFLVLERDNRGVGVDPASLLPIGTKRIYRISLAGATDVSSISLAGTNSLPVGVTPVSKSLFLDIAGALQAAGAPVAEKWEGLVVGPRLKSGNYAILVGTDNDFSVTQTGSGEQFDVYTDGTQAPIDSAVPGKSLLPIYMLSFAGDVPGFAPGTKK